MKKFLILMGAFRKGDWGYISALLVMQLLGLNRKYWISLFPSSLVEARSIIPFIYTNSGTVTPSADYLLAKFRFKNSEIVLKLRWGTSDFVVFNQIFIREEYQYLISNSTSPKNIVDAGANIGCTSVYLKVLFPGSRIIAIEPDPNNFQILKENFLLNGLPDDDCICCALWYKNAATQLANNYRDEREWSRQLSDTEGIAVNTLTLSNLLSENDLPNPQVLKMDIEGAELDIFQYDDSLDNILDDVECMAIEVHEDKLGIVKDRLIKAHFALRIAGETLFAYKTLVA